MSCLSATRDLEGIQARLPRLLRDDGRSEEEQARLRQLMLLFLEQDGPPEPRHWFPDYEKLRSHFIGTLDGTDGEAVEEAFLLLYCHLHMHEAPYTPEERRRVDETGGYWCHAGGLSPLLKAGPWIKPDTISADFGAGNGLQGLLFQKLYPHARTVQIEISSKMVEIGRGLQAWLEIPEERVEWRVMDVMKASPMPHDFIYLYRPVRPEGEGREFYRNFSDALARRDRPVVIFSIADCLRSFLSPRFEVFYSDGHLTCYQGPMKC